MPEPIWTFDRRRLLGLGGLAALATVAACQSAPAPTSDAHAQAGPTGEHKAEGPLTSAQAIDRLKAGNERFATGASTHPDQTVADRNAVADHQSPFALVHGCVDSRVSPELVFDQGIGDIFTTRNAAAIKDDTIVGSMEFALGKAYQVPLIVVLGHTSCGAVTATVDAMAASPTNPTAPGDIRDIVDAIAPVARQVPANPDKAAYINAVVLANTLSVAKGVIAESAIIRDAVKAGRTQVVPAIYDLKTGRVTWQPAAT